MRALIFDTETTGLIENSSIPLEKQPHVIEFYGCVADLTTGEIGEEINQLIKAPVSVSAEITRITGLTAEDLKDSPPFEDVAPAIKEIIETAPVIIAHNLSFDKEMIDLEFQRLGKKIKWPDRLICTVEATIHIKGHRFNLKRLHTELFGVAFADAHRAKNDVMALLSCCIELYKRGEI